MRTPVTLILVVSLGTGCVTGSRSTSVVGRSVTVVPTPGSKTGPMKGELIAVEPEKIWVLGKEHVFEITVAAVKEVRVQRHLMNSGRGWQWTAIGALVTGGALTIACHSVKGTQGCGRVFPWVGATWLVLGGLPSIGLDSSATILVKGPDAQVLNSYARFPAGPPQGLDLSRLPPPSPLSIRAGSLPTPREPRSPTLPATPQAGPTAAAAETPLATQPSEPRPPNTGPSSMPGDAVGLLQIGVRPYADVIIDGEPEGTTPLRALRLAAGVHTIRLLHPDFQPFQRKITIRAGQTKKLEGNLELEGIPK